MSWTINFFFLQMSENHQKVINSQCDITVLYMLLILGLFWLANAVYLASYRDMMGTDTTAHANGPHDAEESTK